MKLILASASPRRAQVLYDAGIRFEARAAHTDETRLPDEPVEVMVRRLAEAKARAVADLLDTQPPQPLIVIGADTVVEIAGQLLGKPGSPKIARHMLQTLSGKEHRVLTGVAILSLPSGVVQSALESTRVRFASLAPEEIDEYVGTSEPLDKAGAYGIQGIGGRFVESIEGCYFNVVGLPLARLYRMLRNSGWNPPHS